MRLTLEKVDGLVGNEVTRQVLGSVNTADNSSTVEIGALEQLQVVGLLNILLELDSAAHHCHRLVSVLHKRLAAETCDGARRVFETSLAGQPPRRFRRDPQEDSERGGEHPLKSNRDPGVDVS